MNITEKVASRRRRLSTPERDDLRSACDDITRLFGLRRLKLDRLDEKEQRALLDLRRKYVTENGGTNLTSLNKGERRGLEELAEKLAGDPGHFERERDEARLRAQVGALARRAVRRPFTRREERGLFDALGRQVSDGYLHGEHVGVLALVLAALASGTAPNRYGRGRVEQTADGPVLVVDCTTGLLGGERDPDHRFLGWQKHLAHLEKNSWVKLTRSGNELRVALGVRATQAMAP